MDFLQRFNIQSIRRFTGFQLAMALFIACGVASEITTVSSSAHVGMQLSIIKQRRWELAIVTGWLLALGMFNWYGPVSLASIFPYLLPILFIAWRHGLSWSFVLAGLATLTAWPAGYAENHSQQELLWAGLTTYAKLSVSAIGFIIGKKFVENKK